LGALCSGAFQGYAAAGVFQIRLIYIKVKILTWLLIVVKLKNRSLYFDQ